MASVTTVSKPGVSRPLPLTIVPFGLTTTTSTDWDSPKSVPERFTMLPAR